MDDLFLDAAAHRLLRGGGARPPLLHPPRGNWPAGHLAMVLALLPGLDAPAAAGSDWPEWRGPSRNGTSSEANWLQGWPAGSVPPVAWRAFLGKGHSAVSVSNARAYSLGWSGTEDTVYCFDAATGQVLWKRSYPQKT